MAVKRFFDGFTLTEVELPDAPFPEALGAKQDAHSLITPQNPLGVDPTLLKVDAAALPNLVPTDGARPTPKFPEPLPGSGEGAGVGQRSTTTGILADPWNNNPNREPSEIETVQSGDVGSALAPSVAKAAQVTNAKLSNGAVAADDLDSMTKAQLADYVTAAGQAPVEGNKPELLAQAKEIAAQSNGELV